MWRCALGVPVDWEFLNLFFCTLYVCSRPDVFARLGRKAKTMLHAVTQELEIKSRTGGIHMVEIPSNDGSDGVAWPICSCYHGAEGLHSATRVGIVLRVLCPGSLKPGSLVCVVEFEQQNCIDIQAKIDSMSCISLTIRFKMITMPWPFG